MQELPGFEDDYNQDLLTGEVICNMEKSTKEKVDETNATKFDNEICHP
jgi:hypothetical protein